MVFEGAASRRGIRVRAGVFAGAFLLGTAALGCGGGSIGDNPGDETACAPGADCSGGSGGSGGMDLGFGGSTSTGTSTGQGGACADVDVSFSEVIPTVVLLIDQSGSMTSSFGNGTRWSVLRDALMNPDTGIVKALESHVRFGVALYSGDGGANCPIVTEVSTALGNYDAIQAVYGSASPLDETPTGESVTQVAATLAPYPEPGPKYIVLATDGEPDTCAQPNPQNGQAQAIAAVQAAYAQGIGTFIVAVGDEVSLGHQQDMANAGAGLPIGGVDNAPYYPAVDPAALVDALSTIIGGVRSCVFDVDGAIDPDQAAAGTVKLDDQTLGYGDADGWKLVSPTQIELVGSACDALQSGEHQVSAKFPCGSVTPDPK